MKYISFVSLLLVGLSSVALAGAVPSPTPEPASIALMAAGLGGVGFIAWKRRRK